MSFDVPEKLRNINDLGVTRSDRGPTETYGYSLYIDFGVTLCLRKMPLIES